MRILVLIAIGLLLYIIVGNMLRKKKRLSSSDPGAERMVRCRHCGLHLSEKEAISSGKQYYCSQSHLEAEQQAK